MANAQYQQHRSRVLLSGGEFKSGYKLKGNGPGEGRDAIRSLVLAAMG